MPEIAFAIAYTLFVLTVGVIIGARKATRALGYQPPTWREISNRAKKGSS